MKKNKTASIRINEEIKRVILNDFKTSPQKIVDEWIKENIKIDVVVKTKRK